eukprot:TRINITY_DN81986_c0_g1_i1.p1 TRINITY_DN81986_c0_g1~~TRINITY_DN81986_c0_g1_i1.p1  ORF type:complete len:259 (+),score=15.18 TRINITY_DN81986_c0_g1_i1:74-850(+)
MASSRVRCAFMAALLLVLVSSTRVQHEHAASLYNDRVEDSERVNATTDTQLDGQLAESAGFGITSFLEQQLQTSLHGAEIVNPEVFSGRIVLLLNANPSIVCAETIRASSGVGAGITGLNLWLRLDLQGVNFHSQLPGCCFLDGMVDIHFAWSSLRVGLVKPPGARRYRGFVSEGDERFVSLRLDKWHGRSGVLSHGLALARPGLNALIPMVLPDKVVEAVAEGVDQYAGMTGMQTMVSVLTSVWAQTMENLTCSYQL